MRPILLLSLASIVASVFGPLPDRARAESLGQAVARAVARFPEIQAAQARRAAVEAQTGQARAELLPSVNLTAGEGRETSRNLSTRNLPEDPTLTRREADLSVSQLLFDGGAALNQVRRFAALTQSARFSVSTSAENVALRTGQAYVDVLRLREQLGVARDNLAVHQRTLGDVSALADAGRGRRADVTQAEARLALAASAVEQLLGQLEQAEAVYRYLTGVPPGKLERPQPLAPALPPGLDDAVDVATSAHPAVKAGEKAFDAAQHDRDTARARMVAPRLTLEAGASRNRDIEGLVGPNQDNYAMLRLRYNLFRGFGDVERVREAEHRIDESLEELRRVRNEVEREVRVAWQTLAAERARLPQLEQYAKASADVAEAYRLQFQLGQRSLLDVLNAENERFNALAGFITGRAAVSASEMRVLAGLGGLLEALGVPSPVREGDERVPLAAVQRAQRAAPRREVAGETTAAATERAETPIAAEGARARPSLDSEQGLGLRLELDLRSYQGPGD